MGLGPVCQEWEQSAGREIGGGEKEKKNRRAWRGFLRAFRPLLIALALVSLGIEGGANPPVDTPPKSEPKSADRVLPSKTERQLQNRFRKETDAPNPKDHARAAARRRLIETVDQAKGKPEKSLATAAQLERLSLQGSERILVILVEFAGTDDFLFTPGESTWDPIGKCDASEFTGQTGTVIATDNICAFYGIDEPTTYSYAGPLHNAIPRPVSAEDRSATMIWTPDFSSNFYQQMIFGNGVRFQYDREDGSPVDQDFTGQSVRQYYEDLSGGDYSITGDVIGWVQVPHSVWWYGADPAPGARSGASGGHNGGIPDAGDARSLVTDALLAVDAISNTIPGFDWSNYDLDGDGIIDRLWIIHAGLGEEDSPTVLNRTDYGEGGLWSHSSSVFPPFQVKPGDPGVSVGPYIMMPENCGIGVLAHEFAHNLGADDLYAYDGGETSAGFWTLMCDDWTGYPIGYLPPALDPWHLDNWGWLEPYVVNDPTTVHTVTVGQASAFPGGAGVYRGVRIPLKDQEDPLPVTPNGSYCWWGGAEDLTNSGMMLASPVAIPAGGATLSFNLAWDIEWKEDEQKGWDFLWIQVSKDAGATWDTLTNADTISSNMDGWIGFQNGFPLNIAGTGIGGFTGYNAEFPDMRPESFSLAPYAGENILVRFWYMTDWGTVENGAFVDDIVITAGETVLFSDDGETANSNWMYQAPWERNAGVQKTSHNLYLQWRNVSSTGGYDRALGDPMWRFGPANTGLLVWYNNNRYTDNEILYYLTDGPGFGPKGRMLVVDAHPEPYRDPYWVAYGYNNEAGNLSPRSLMRDAPFSLNKCVDFTMDADYVVSPTTVFEGYPAAPLFSDANGYYPGAEFVSRAPDYPENTRFKWVTKQYDASVVIPSTEFYGIKAPGYANEEFRFGGTRYYDSETDRDLMSTYWFGSGVGLGYAGGTGNPSEVNGQHGWNVEIISQTDQTATVKIWNTRTLVAEPDLWCVY